MPNSEENEISQAATLAVIAGLIITLGEGLATVAEALAIEEEARAVSQQNSENQMIQQQLWELMKEIKKIKRALNIH